MNIIKLSLIKSMNSHEASEKKLHYGTKKTKILKKFL